MSVVPFGTVSRGLRIAPDAVAPQAAAVVPLDASQAVGALPLAVDLLLYRGDDFFLDVAVVDNLGAPVDLTGYTATAEVRTDTEANTALATFTATIAINIVHLRLPSAMAAMVSGPTVWDVQVADPTGVVTTLAFGQVTTTPDVTRP